MVGMGAVNLFDNMLKKRNPQSQHIWSSYQPSSYQPNYIALFFLAEDGCDTFEIRKQTPTQRPTFMPSPLTTCARPRCHSTQMGSIWFPQLTRELATMPTSCLGNQQLPPHPQLIEDRCSVSQSEGLLKESSAMDHYLRLADKVPCSSNRQALC